MNMYSGCWIEKLPGGDWAIRWPDASIMERDFSSSKKAQEALSYYKEVTHARIHWAL